MFNQSSIITKELHDKIENVVNKITEEQTSELNTILSKTDKLDIDLIMVWLDGIKMEGVKHPYNYLKKCLENAMDRQEFTKVGRTDEYTAMTPIFKAIKERTHEQEVKERSLIMLIEQELHDKGMSLKDLDQMNIAIIKHEKENGGYFIEWLKKSRAIKTYAIDIAKLEQEVIEVKKKFEKMIADLEKFNEPSEPYKEVDITKKEGN